MSSCESSDRHTGSVLITDANVSPAKMMPSFCANATTGKQPVGQEAAGRGQEATFTFKRRVFAQCCLSVAAGNRGGSQRFCQSTNHDYQGGRSRLEAVSGRCSDAGRSRSEG